MKWLLACCLALWVHTAAANPLQAEHVEVAVVAETQHAQVGHTTLLGLSFKPEAHWHTYWKNPGDSGMPPSVEWELPSGAEAGEILWPRPERIRVAHLMNYGYDGETLLLVPLTLAKDFAEQQITLKAKLNWLVCQEVCVPGSAELSLSLPVSHEPAALNPEWQQAFSHSRSLLPIEVKNWRMEFAYDAQGIGLLIKAEQPIFAQAESVYFFPAQADWIEHAEAQQAQWDPQTLLILAKRSSFFSGEPQLLPGVLAVYGPQGEQFYQLQARLGDSNELLKNSSNLRTQAEWKKQSGHSSADPGLNLFWVLLFAFLGGLILNLMPCVFPVLSLKVLNLVQTRLLSQHAQRMHGLSYAVGVVLSFVLVAGLLLVLQAGGAAIGWGFHLQSSWFVGLLVYVLFMLGLSLSGWLLFGSQLMGVGDSLTRHEAYSGSFFTGVLAVVVASPCTVPFMGTAVGYALTQAPLIALLVFAMLGVGMALPFVLLAFFPGLLRFLPRPGVWMESFKQFMAFPLYATAIWLLWVLGRQSGMDSVALVLSGALALVMAVWLWRRKGLVWLYRGFSLLLLLIALAVLSALPGLQNAVPSQVASSKTQEHSINWEAYSPERLAQLRAENKPVFVNMTADWCITCLVNEQVALNTEVVRNAFAEQQINYLKGDWTRYDAQITQVLNEYGRSGVPLYLYYAPGKEALVLPQLLSVERVLDTLKNE